MAVLAASAIVQLATESPDAIETHDCVASDILYQGSILGFSSGNVRPCTAGDNFAGIAMEEWDNSSGAAGAKRIRVLSRGVLKGISAITGASNKTNIGTKVYATNDNPANMTLTSTSNTLIGVICGYNSDAGFDVRFRSSTHLDIDTTA